MAVKRKKGAKGGKGKGGKKGRKKKAKKNPQYPIEVNPSETVEQNISVAYVQKRTPEQYQRILTRFDVYYVHPNHPELSEKVLKLSPIDTEEELFRRQVRLQVFQGDRIETLWMMHGYNPERPLTQEEIDEAKQKEEEEKKRKERGEFLFSGEEEVVEDPKLKPTYHAATIKAKTNNSFSIRVTNEHVFAKIAFDLRIDDHNVSRLYEVDAGSFIDVKGFESDNPGENIWNRFMFSKKEVETSKKKGPPVDPSSYGGVIIVTVYI